jgi:hypothetical protein
MTLEETIETASAEETVVVNVPYSYYEDEANPSTIVMIITAYCVRRLFIILLIIILEEERHYLHVGILVFLCKNDVSCT